MTKKKFKSLFVELKEMPGLRKKIEELLADKRNVALSTHRERLRKMYNRSQTEPYPWDRYSKDGRDFINSLYEDHKRWEKAREQKR